MGPEEVEWCLAALGCHGYSVKERRHGWLVIEPMGGRQRVDSVEQLAAYTDQVVKREERATLKEEMYEASTGENHTVEDGGDGKHNMIYGAVCAAIGVVITGATYEAAADGGTYVVAYGAMGTGVVLFVAGVCQRLKHISSAGRGLGDAEER